MAFGSKTGSLKNLKQTLAKGGGSGAFIKYIPRNGVMNVRFITEPEEWHHYVEHFDQVARRSFPCNGELSCPGCKSDARKSSRYLANAVDLDDNKRVIPLQMPKDLANRLVVKYEKWGTITDRDLELSRSGEGLDTVYDLDASAPSRMNLKPYEPHNLEKVLEDAYNSVFGPDDPAGFTEEEPKPARGRTRSAAARTYIPTDTEAADSEEEGEEEAPPAPKAKRKSPAKKAAPKAPEPTFAVDDEDDEDDSADDPDVDDDEQDVTYDEATLRALPLGALRSVARDFGVPTRGKDADTIIQAILDSGEEVDGGDDEPPF